MGCTIPPQTARADAQEKAPALAGCISYKGKQNKNKKKKGKKTRKNCQYFWSFWLVIHVHELVFCSTFPLCTKKGAALERFLQEHSKSSSSKAWHSNCKASKKEFL